MWIKVDYSKEAKKNPRPNMSGEWAIYTKRHWWNKWVERQTYADINMCTRYAEKLVDTRSIILNLANKMDYEQKYKEAFEKAKKLQETCDSTAVVGWCEYIFPELKISEGERIRKELIEHIKANEYADYVLFKKFSPDDVIAWLEKQEEPLDKIAQRARTEKQRVLVTESDGVANIDWDTRSLQDVKLLLEYGLDYIKKIEKQGEQKPADNIDKPWSEDDNKHFERILKELKNQWQRPYNRPYLNEIVSDYYWLESLKNRVQPKQEWSEEDEKHFSWLIEHLSQSAGLYNNLINWLKSLKGRYTWKPSDEQMITLRQVISGCSYDIEP